MKYIVQFNELDKYGKYLESAFPAIYNYLGADMKTLLDFALFTFSNENNNHVLIFIETIYQHIDTMIESDDEESDHRFKKETIYNKALDELYSYNFSDFINNFFNYIKHCLYNLFKENEFVINEIIDVNRSNKTLLDIDYVKDYNNQSTQIRQSY